jgi:hypothetical protein
VIPIYSFSGWCKIFSWEFHIFVITWLAKSKFKLT